MIKLKYALISLVRKSNAAVDKQFKSCPRLLFVYFAMLISATVVVFHLGKISAFAQEYQVVRGIIDIHSKISDGRYTQEQIAARAQEKGFKVLIFSESALRKWEYGLWPLRNIIKKVYQENSVLRLGPKKYIEKLASVKKQFPNLVLIPGVETSPFFYWDDSPFSRHFGLIDYYKQFLVFGLKPQDYENMPIVGNRQFFYFSKNTLFSLWPILVVIFGLRFLRKWILKISLILIGIIFLLNNLPFPTSRFNVYHGNQGIKPYQDLIDYVNQRGGFIFLAHPETLSQVAYFSIGSYTIPHSEDLFLEHDYTGFGVRDTFEIAEPGNIWDQLLLEYVEGKRKKPAWIIGALHYTDEDEFKGNPETSFFIKELDEKHILDALRQGRMYVRFDLGGEPVVLNEFSAKNVGSGSIRIIIKGTQVSSSEPLKIQLIRNGEVIKDFEEIKNDWMIITEDKLLEKEKRAYYRLKINSNSSIIFSNPVFVASEE